MRIQRRMVVLIAVVLVLASGIIGVAKLSAGSLTTDRSAAETSQGSATILMPLPPGTSTQDISYKETQHRMIEVLGTFGDAVVNIYLAQKDFDFSKPSLSQVKVVGAREVGGIFFLIVEIADTSSKVLVKYSEVIAIHVAKTARPGPLTPATGPVK